MKAAGKRPATRAGRGSTPKTARADAPPSGKGRSRFSGKAEAGAAPPQAAERLRLQVVLARAGHGSRRACEELIRAGRVSVNGEPVTKLGTTVDCASQTVTLDGQQVSTEPPVYRILHKPRGVITTARDPEGRPTVLDLVQEKVRLFPVGRLDCESEGLVLLTNDGELAQRLLHPRYGVIREYVVRVGGRVTPEALEQIRQGVRLSEGRTGPAQVKTGPLGRQGSLLTLRLREGRNREVRRILAKVDLKVRRLTRTRFGTLHLGTLKPGQSRRLSSSELNRLRASTKPGTVQNRGATSGAEKGQAPLRSRKGAHPVSARKRTPTRRPRT